MSEYELVEKPFLNQLASMGWKIIEQGGVLGFFPRKKTKPSVNIMVYGL